MSSSFTQQELSHYNRHFLLPEIGMEGQKRLKQSRVLVVGAGGLGSPALLYLAAAGIGTIGILDDDKVEASNLHRQVLYSYDDIGTKKIVAAKNRLEKLNPAINIVLHDTRLVHDNALEIIKQYDCVADGSDNFATRYIVNDACFQLKKPSVYASIFRFEGQCSVFNANNGACFRCLFDAPPAPHLMPSCAEAGVLGVLPGIMGSIQANEIIKIILGIGKPLVNRLLIFNALEMKFRELAISVNPDCRLCKHHQSYDTLPNHQFETCSLEKDHMKDQMTVAELKALTGDYLLLDVREQFEYDICNLGGKLIPLKTLPERLHELNKSQHIVVHCKSGGRSQQAIQFLRQQGFNHLSNLQGGILAWIDQIDPTMTKY